MTEASGLAVIYALPPGSEDAAHVALALGRLSGRAERLLIVVRSQAVLPEIDGGAAIDLIASDAMPPVPEAGYKAGLLQLWSEGWPGQVLLTGAHVMGPIAGQPVPAPWPGGLAAPYWHDSDADPRLLGRGLPDRVPYLDHTVLSAELMGQQWFQTFWNTLEPTGQHWDDFLACAAELSRDLERNGAPVAFPDGSEILRSADPRLLECHCLIEAGAPCLPVATLTLDPLLADLNAMNLSSSLETLREVDPELHSATMAFAARTVRARDFAAVADRVWILPREAQHEADDVEIGVFIHAYYATMMPEFWELISKLDVPFRLYLTTATDENRDGIEAFLAARGLQPDRFEVRVVEQNRGRDMSSLFITWRDVALSGRHEIALRLHSKRTPQVPSQVGESFKAHLFGNLVASPGYVRNVIRRMKAEPEVGVVTPPVIHSGFGTLGHSWFNNRRPLISWLTRMGIDVPLDADTPVAPYGTMYWFRPDALRPIFEWPWDWSDYNPEPHHIDGGLAHVQERMISYVAQSRGYGTVSVMTPEAAARSYAKLEYKLQRLAALLPAPDILGQVHELERRRSTIRWRCYRRAEQAYGTILRRWPGAKRPLRPVKSLVVAALGMRGATG
ncbi:rhamnan synthesis F family protein [Roseicyclus sp. F158]|uniref:Rhamnan synthesis F family protein n=1 Tax=Tropicimonas omnivorans TaxID=3075590 RepID=A0ABU3DBW8_9RHOB|nr:rhamnan synthesis F family protein [Roseicyclus sp. F158]MDT0681200.1 rhamnan synthesis F family protein [Roseicyclus sp. F158]